jgi:hypothetical protein
LLLPAADRVTSHPAELRSVFSQLSRSKNDNCRGLFIVCPATIFQDRETLGQPQNAADQDREIIQVFWETADLNWEMLGQDRSTTDLDRETIAVSREATEVFRETILVSKEATEVFKETRKVSWEIVSRNTLTNSQDTVAASKPLKIREIRKKAGF